MSPAEPASKPGTRFLAEIREQPTALRRLLEHDDEVARIAAAVRDRDLRLVRMVGHGSSDNAASFGVYAFGLLPRWTALRDSITLSVAIGKSAVLTEVTDEGPPFDPHHVTPEDPDRGWGLVLVERLAPNWGVKNDAGSKRVWFELGRA